MSFSRKSSTTSHGNSRDLVDLRRPRRDPLAGERAHEVADLPLLVGQRIPRARRDESYGPDRAVILENGVDPDAGAAAADGARAWRSRATGSPAASATHETALADARARRSRRAAASCRGCTTPTCTSRRGRSRSARCGLDGCRVARRGARAGRARRRRAPDGPLAARLRLAERRLVADASSRRGQDLDARHRRRPAALIAKDYHSLWLNSAALALADGDLEVAGGVVERDERGEPTGVLREECGLARSATATSTDSDDEYVEAMRAGVELAAPAASRRSTTRTAGSARSRLWQRLAERGGARRSASGSRSRTSSSSARGGGAALAASATTSCASAT